MPRVMPRPDVGGCLGHCHVEFDIALGIFECIKFAIQAPHARHKPIQFLDVRIRGAKSRELSCDALDTVAQFRTSSTVEGVAR